MRKRIFFTLLVTTVLVVIDAKAFDIDLSRRRKNVQKKENSEPTVQGRQSQDVFYDLFTSSEPSQELVILNTEQGFVPAKVSLRKGGKYTIHLVNVNEKEKNVSFILDAFSEHHATYYGKIKSFEIKPAQEGVFSFQCPETSSEGRLVIFSPEPKQQQRAISSENKE